MKKKNHYNEAMTALNRLHKLFPTYTLGQHLATALSDYGDIWSISDKEMLYALEKYEAELELDHHGKMNIEKIINEGTTMKFDEEEYFDEDNF